LICPACKTNNAPHKNIEYCVQCGSDLHVHRLLQTMHEETRMNKTINPSKQDIHHPKKMQLATTFLVVMQTIVCLTLLTCTVFGIYVGIQFLNYIDNRESQQISAQEQWFQTGFQQLQQMNTTIKQELELIIDLHHENQVLQKEVRNLETNTAALKGQNSEVQKIQ